MGLLSPQGIAGRVVKVGESFAVALSALNGAFKAAAQTEQGYSGAVFEWRGGDIKTGYLNGVPSNVSVEAGEVVYTAAHSLIFPEKFPIGTIASVEDDPQAPGFYAITINLATDFANLDHLYFIDVTYRNQVDSLQQDLIK